VILPRDGTAEQRFGTLAQAVRSAQIGDTIEIHGNGPFLCQPIPIATPITLRAAAGFSPVLQLDGEAVKVDRPAIETTASLTLEGLVFHRIGNGRLDAYNPRHIISHRADLRIANCRFLIDSENAYKMYAVRGEQSPHLDVRNCQFFGPWNYGVNWTMAAGGHMSVDNSLFASTRCVALTHSVPILEDVTVSVTGNTFVSDEIFGVMTGANPRSSTAKVPGARVQSSSNVWYGGVLSATAYGFKDQDEVQAFEDAAVLRGWLDWRDQNNLYRSGRSFLVSTASGPASRRVPLAKNHAEWNDFWGLEATGSLQGEILFRGGDLRAQSAALLEQLPPDDFRLAPQSPGAGAGPNGEDLGANVDLVGPGPAYERWKTTPDYQQWLEEAPK
jgi:hypothetical protein